MCSVLNLLGQEFKKKRDVPIKKRDVWSPNAEVMGHPMLGYLCGLYMTENIHN
jgi:hypothetical protein